MTAKSVNFNLCSLWAKGLRLLKLFIKTVIINFCKIFIPEQATMTETTHQGSSFILDRLRHVPLAEAMRPANLEEYFGQDEVAGKDGFWRSLIQTGKIPSMILWGPPGCGKTR